MGQLVMLPGAAQPSLAPAVDAARPAPGSMEEQLDAIHNWCRVLSARHRLSFPRDLVRERIHGLARSAGSLFQDRVVEICFLLDQYGALRYNELRRSLGAISTRTLADKLAFMQQEGIVMRTLFDATPPRVEYRLSPRGKTLTDLLFPALVHVARPSRPTSSGMSG